MPLRNVATTFTIEQQRLEINLLAGDVNNIATGVTNVGTAATANALAAGATGADLTLSGTLTVNGSQTILNTATLEVEDKNIIIAKGSTTDAAASGGGITLKGANDKTISYNQTGDKWESNKPFEASNLLYNSGNQELNGHLAVNTTDATIANNGPFVVHIDTDKNIGYSGGLSEIGNVPGVVAFHDTGALQDFGMRGITLRFAAGSAERLRITDNGLSVNANHDVRFENGTWSGEVPGKIQHNSNWLYIQGGTSGIKFRKSDGSLNSLECDGDGNATFAGQVSATRVDCDGLFHIQYGNATNTNYMSSFSNSNGIMHLFRGDGLYIGDNMNTSNQAGGPNLSNIRLKTNGVIECDSTISDSKGNLRRIPRNEPTSGTAYTLVNSDMGKFISHGANVIMAANSTFATGDAITIYNYSGSAITIDASTNSATLHWTDGTTAATGDRTLAARGVATLLCVEGSNNTWVITGSLT